LLVQFVPCLDLASSGPHHGDRRGEIATRRFNGRTDSSEEGQLFKSLTVLNKLPAQDEDPILLVW
jgi:hypothetical protein